ncbi:MAG: metallophosphoesterase family protein [Pirellulaceae bacterium]
MRIGLLADIHGHVEHLRSALDLLRRRHVDRFIVLGDVIYDAKNAAETVELLAACGAVGVWGNHELGLCIDPDDELRRMYTEPVIEFFRTLQPRMELEDLLFSHTTPSEDPADPLAYYLGPRLTDDGALDASFAQFPHRVMMTGHFHRWFAATPAGQFDWDGRRPIELNPDMRYLLTVDAVMNRRAALLDTQRNLLTPLEF